MTIGDGREERLAALPRTIGADARLYLQPARLAAGDEALTLLAGGAALPLAGGRIVFGGLEVIVRRRGRLRRALASLDETRRWADGIGGSVRERVGGLLEHLSAPRDGLDGARLVRPLLMGVVNVTPDSFSDGGDHVDAEAAVAFARRLIAEGADILDIGGESTRPFATPVPPEVECRRVLPVLERLRAAGPPFSIDTRHASVMEAALAAGASIVNDVSALTHDRRSLEVAAASRARVVLMHMQGDPATMQVAPVYEHAALDVYDALEARVQACLAAGIDRQRLIVDPGICFGKHEPDNLAVLRNLALYHGLGCPVLLGVSRKGYTAEIEERWRPRERLASSLAAALYGLDRGVQFLRVHDVDATRQALVAWEALTPG